MVSFPGRSSPRRLAAALAVAAFVLATAVRLPGLGAGPLTSAERAVLATSRGLDPDPARPRVFPPPADAARGGDPELAAAVEVPWPPYVHLLERWSRRVGPSELTLRLPSAALGAGTVVLVVLVAARLAGGWAAMSAGLFLALSPIHTLASREAVPGAALVFLFTLSLALVLRLEERAGPVDASVHGLTVGLVTPASPVLLVLALLQMGWLGWRRERRRAAAVSMGVAALTVAATGVLGLLRSPLAEPVASWIPSTTALGLVRCAGASWTRLVGLEYHLAVPHARHVAPLTLLFVALMAIGALRLAPRLRSLLAAGAALPLVAGAGLAIATGRVAPLQASRLLPVLPVVALMAGVGLASLRGWRRWSALALVVGTLVAFLALALSTPRPEADPTATRLFEPAER